MNNSESQKPIGTTPQNKTITNNLLQRKRGPTTTLMDNQAENIESYLTNAKQARTAEKYTESVSAVFNSAMDDFGTTFLPFADENDIAEEAKACIKMKEDGKTLNMKETMEIFAINVFTKLNNINMQVNNLTTCLGQLTKGVETTCVPMASVVPQIAILAKQKEKNSARYKNRFLNMQKSWAASCQNFLVKNPIAGGDAVQLKTLDRLTVAKMVKEMQDDEVKNRPPMLGNRNLKVLIQCILGKYYAWIDDPNTLGIAVAQFLFPHDHFQRQHMPLIGTGHRESTLPPGKAELPEEHFNLWKATMLYIGGCIFKMKADFFTDNNIWDLWLSKARENVHHRAKQEANDNGKTESYVPKNFKPITTRNTADDGDWLDVELARLALQQKENSWLDADFTF